ncbi:MAG TPA: ATP-binding protein, partial [Bacteroidia bacterium]|nr:ATP-binding protein [Bacteroidia bacterium]
MSTTPAQIDLWLASPSETRKLEFKEAKAQFPRDRLYKYCVAIANEGGGHLLLGVTDGKPRRVVGTSAFGNPVATESEIFNTLGFRVDIDEVSHPEGRVLVFQIPGRPLGTAYAYEGVRWMRVGEELRQMSDDRLRQIFAEGQPDFVELTAKDGCSEEEIVMLLDTASYYDLR